jgi:hypothetical protein
MLDRSPLFQTAACQPVSFRLIHNTYIGPIFQAPADSKKLKATLLSDKGPRRHLEAS